MPASYKLVMGVLKVGKTTLEKQHRITGLAIKDNQLQGIKKTLPSNVTGE